MTLPAGVRSGERDEHDLRSGAETYRYDRGPDTAGHIQRTVRARVLTGGEATTARWRPECMPEQCDLTAMGVTGDAERKGVRFRGGHIEETRGVLQQHHAFRCRAERLRRAQVRGTDRVVIEADETAMTLVDEEPDAMPGVDLSQRLQVHAAEMLLIAEHSHGLLRRQQGQKPLEIREIGPVVDDVAEQHDDIRPPPMQRFRHAAFKSADTGEM